MLLWGQREREVTYLVIRRVRDSLPVEEEDLKKMGGGRRREEQVGYWSEAERRAESWPGANWVKAGWMVRVRLQVV